MRHHEGQRIWFGRAAVEEMDLEPIDVRRELLEPVELTLLLTPVESVTPVVNQFLQVGEVGAEGPAHTFGLIGETGTRQSFLKVGEYIIRDVDRERLDQPLRSLGRRRGYHQSLCDERVRVTRQPGAGGQQEGERQPEGRRPHHGALIICSLEYGQAP